MQIANAFLSLGGDHGNTVPKTCITPAEALVLAAIHGEDAVRDITIVEGKAEDDGKPRANRAELERLNHLYGRAKDGENKSILKGLFPGTGAQVPKEFADIGLPDECYANLTAPQAKSIHDMKKAELIAYAQTNGHEIDPKATVAEIVDAIEAAGTEGEGDGIGAMG